MWMVDCSAASFHASMVIRLRKDYHNNTIQKSRHISKYQHIFCLIVSQNQFLCFSYANYGNLQNIPNLGHESVDDDLTERYHTWSYFE